jgi:UDP-2,4-diacetamido-2,4,6-trideoxy-beta-L-altropyranose hydrolase
MVIDDLADRAHDCAILLDQTAGRVEDAYRPLVPADCRLLLGSDYALLRAEFADRRSEALAARAQRDGLRRVLVAFGSTDPENGTGLALDAIAQSGLAVETDVMLGHAAPWIEDVRRRAAGLPVPGRVHVGVADPWELMAAADLAIGAPGTTSWERCCLGLPSLLLEMADNQKFNARILAASGAAEVVGTVPAVTAADLAAALKRLTPARLRELSTKAAACCDGGGVDRVVAEIEHAVAAATPAS